MNIPTAEDFCKQLDDIHGMSKDVIQSHIDFAKLCVKAALELASEKATWKCDTKDTCFGDENRGNYDFESTGGDGDVYEVHFISVNKESILNACNLDDIK